MGMADTFWSCDLDHLYTLVPLPDKFPHINVWETNLTRRKLGQGQLRVIYIIFVQLESAMFHVKLQDPLASGSEKDV